MTTDQVPIEMYIATYADRAAAQADWDALKELATNGVITVDALVLVERDTSGTIHVMDNAQEAEIGAEIGAVAGAVIGQIFPPALVDSAAVGAERGGASALLDYHLKSAIKADVEEEVPPETTDIVTLFQERWVTRVEDALGKADNISRHWVDPGSINDVKESATQASAVR